MPAASAAAAALVAAPAKAVELAGKGLQAKASGRIRGPKDLRHLA